MPLLFNTDVAMLFVQPDREDDFFYRNAQGDEIVYVSDGAGVLQTQLGDIPFAQGDYLVIPRGIMHRYTFTGTPVRCLVIESRGYVRTPKRYRNEHGQLTEMSPFSERDIRRPSELPTHDARGEHKLVVKKESRLYELILAWHPFDVVGWDGYYYPWAFNIHNFEPRVGRVHLPPPVHQTFEGDNFVVCSFCPRPYDFDPQRGAGAVQPLERDVGRGDLLRELRVHEPQGNRVRLGHAAPGRRAARAASRAHRGIARRAADRRARGDARHLPPAAGQPAGAADRGAGLLPFLAGRVAGTSRLQAHQVAPEAP